MWAHTLTHKCSHTHARTHTHTHTLNYLRMKDLGTGGLLVENACVCAVAPWLGPRSRVTEDLFPQHQPGASFAGSGTLVLFRGFGSVPKRRSEPDLMFAHAFRARLCCASLATGRDYLVSRCLTSWLGSRSAACHPGPLMTPLQKDTPFLNVEGRTVFFKAQFSN